MQAEVIVKRATANVTHATDTSPHRTRGGVDRDLFCRRLEAYLCGAAAAHGLTGNLGSVVASIERGGASGGTEFPNLAMLRRIGWREGKSDVFDEGQRPSYHLGRLRDDERRFRTLSTKHQQTALALYLGTTRAHETLRASFGEMAGVVLHRWQIKQAKTRGRDATVGGATAEARLAAIRTELGPLEGSLAELRAKDRRQPGGVPDPRPVDPCPPLVLRRRYLDEARQPYLQELQRWHERQAQARLGWQLVLGGYDSQLAELDALARPLRAESATLCAEQATRAAMGAVVDDEQQLIDLSRKWTEAVKTEHVAAAETEVRAMHRTWYAAQKAAAKAWAEDTTAA